MSGQSLSLLRAYACVLFAGMCIGWSFNHGSVYVAIAVVAAFLAGTNFQLANEKERP